jgi:hypothetical protein
LRLIVVDFESPMMVPGMQAPPPCAAGVCGDVDLVEDPHCVRAVEHETVGRDDFDHASFGGASPVPIWLISAASPQWSRVLDLFGLGPSPAGDGSHVLANHRLRFDACVAMGARPDLQLAVLERHRRGLAACTELRERLLDISAGVFMSKEKYSLQTVAQRYGVETAPKDDGTRTGYYAIYRDPIARWPEAARRYLALDVRAPRQIFRAQERRAESLPGGALDDAPRQAAWHLAMELISVHGVRTDPDVVERYRRETQAELERGRVRLAEVGLIEWQRRSGTWKRNKKRAQAYAAEVWARLGFEPPRSPAGGIKMDEVAAEQSHDEILIAYQKFGAATSASSHVEEVAAGVRAPIHTHYDLVETGRTASWGPNLQNRKAKPGDRECFVPDLGLVYDDRDADGLELRTVAQVCVTLFGHSRLAEILNAGGDPHLYLASQMPVLQGIPYEEIERRYKAKDPIVVNARQSGKIGNFSFWGGSGPAVVSIQAWAKYRTKMTVDEAARLRAVFFRAYPEARQYLDWIGTLAPRGSLATIRQLFSGRVRGGCKFTDRANGFFQSLGGDACKAATFALQVACRTPGHLLYGCRPEHFVHDQWLTAVPEDPWMADRSKEIKRVIETAANVYLPDVPLLASGCLVRRWSKESRAMTDVDGRALPWEWPPAIDAWCARWGDLGASARRAHAPAEVCEVLDLFLGLDARTRHTHAGIVAEAKRLPDGPEKDALKALAAKIWREVEEVAAYVSLARSRIERGIGHSVDAGLLYRATGAIEERLGALVPRAMAA